MPNFIGRVVDQKNQPIKDAKVSFEGLGTPLVNYTDTEGIFRFSIDIIRGSVVNINIRVEAQGYKPYNRYTDLSVDHIKIEEIRLIEENLSNHTLVPIKVAIITAIATVLAALIAALMSNSKLPYSTPKEPIQNSPSLSNKEPSEVTLQQNMQYKEARKVLIQQGWQASLPGSIGQFPDLENPTVKKLFDLGYEEVKDCSGTGLGFCRFEFTNQKGELLVVSATAVGSESGERIVRNWWIEKEPTSTP